MYSKQYIDGYNEGFSLRPLKKYDGRMHVFMQAFFCPLFRMKANPKTFKYLSFPKNYLSFLKAYVVKSSEKPGFGDFFDLSFFW